MAHAYDVTIMRRRLQDIKEVFIWLVEQTSKMGLEVNKKDKIYDHITQTYNENAYVKFGTYIFEIVEN